MDYDLPDVSSLGILHPSIDGKILAGRTAKKVVRSNAKIVGSSIFIPVSTEKQDGKEQMIDKCPLISH